MCNQVAVNSVTAPGARIAAILLLLFVFPGCREPSVSPPTSREQQIASEVEDFLKKKLAALPETHELVQRYGSFQTMDSTTVVRVAPSRAPFGETSLPARLEVQCHCRFSRFPEVINVWVLQGDVGSKISFYLQPTEFVMEPTHDTVTTGVLSNSTLELRGNELWIVKTDDQNIAVQSSLSCWIKHPEFGR